MYILIIINNIIILNMKTKIYSMMKSFLSVLPPLFFAFSAFFLSGCIFPEKISGRISSDTIWQGRILLEGDVYVEEGVRLTILPGVSIRYSSGDIKNEVQMLRSSDGSTYDIFGKSKIEIIVAGELDISGTEENPVVITAPTDEPGRAGGISFVAGGNDSKINHLSINGGHIGLRLYDNRSPELNDITIRGAIAGGIGCWDRSAPEITRAEVISGKYGIGASSLSAPIISSSTIKNNSATGVFFEGQSRGVLRWSHISGNNVGVASGNDSTPLITDNIIEGNGSGVGIWNNASPAIKQNTFISNIVGLLALNDSVPEAENNIFKNNGGGASFGDSSKGIFRMNLVSMSGPGVVLRGSSSPEISSNTFMGNEYGLRAEGRSASLISSNSFRENRFALILSEYSKPVLSGNEFQNNLSETVDSRF